MNKENVKKEAKKKIDELFNEIDELNAKKEEAKGEAKQMYEEKLADLKVQKAKLEKKYTELENAAEDKWEEAKNAFDSAAKSFKEGISEMTSLVS